MENKIWYVLVEEQFETTFLKKDYFVFFNSTKAKREWKKRFRSHNYTLKRIKKEGIAKWDEFGILGS